MDMRGSPGEAASEVKAIPKYEGISDAAASVRNSQFEVLKGAGRQPRDSDRASAGERGKFGVKAKTRAVVRNWRFFSPAWKTPPISPVGPWGKEDPRL